MRYDARSNLHEAPDPDQVVRSAPVEVEKVWSDEAREAAAETRRARTQARNFGTDAQNAGLRPRMTPAQALRDAYRPMLRPRTDADRQRDADARAAARAAEGRRRGGAARAASRKSEETFSPVGQGANA